MAKISITIPVYNGAKYLRDTLDSIMNQTFQDWECICVDDGSSDDSLSILKEYEQKDIRFKVYKKSNGKWASRTVKFALSNATGDYWRYASQDDIYSPDLLEKDIKRIEDTGADLCLPIMIWYDGGKIQDQSISKQGGYIGYKGDLNAIISGRESFLGSIGYRYIHGFALYKMSLIRQNGYFDYGYNSDSYTTRVLMISSKKVVFSDGVFYYRQNNPKAITKAFSSIQFGAIDTNRKLRELVQEKHVEEVLPFINGQALRDIINLQVSIFANKKIITRKDLLDFEKKIKEEWSFLRNQARINQPTILKLFFLQSFSLFLFFSKLLYGKRMFVSKKIM